MKRASYKIGVEFIALNDNAGDDAALEWQNLIGYISVALLADLFDVTQEKVAEDVVRYRRTHRPVQFTRDQIGARNVLAAARRLGAAD